MLKLDGSYGLHIVCYDIRNDQRRRRLVHELEAFGLRVQESVFECWIDAVQARKIMYLLGRVIHQGEDGVACYRLAGEPGEIMLIGGQVSDEPDCVVV